MYEKTYIYLEKSSEYFHPARKADELKICLQYLVNGGGDPDSYREAKWLNWLARVS